MDRESFLRRVREAAAQGRRYRVQVRESFPPRAGYVGGGDEPVARFVAELNAVGGHGHVLSAEEARALVVDLARRHSARSVLCWDHPLLTRLGIGEALASAGVEVLSPDVPARRDFEAWRDRMFAAELGVSAVDWAVAETGTMALAASPAQPRSASLLPPVHVALVDPARIVPDLFDLFAELERLEGGMPSNLALITGPSKTGDIELKLTTGVHGPGEVHAVVVRGGC